jgi:hypothetical protein
MGGKRNKRLPSLVLAGMAVLVAAGCINQAMAEPYCGDPNHPYPVGDLSGPEGVPDCRVDLYDFAVLASHWLEDTCTVRTTYVFQPDPNALTVSGGIGGGDFGSFSIEGQFDLTVDSCAGTAWFSSVDAQISEAIWDTDSLDVLFDMTELVSTDVSETEIGFLLDRGYFPGFCWDGYCMTDIHLRVTFIGDSVHLVGDFCEPLADGFCYHLDAVAVRQP